MQDGRLVVTQGDRANVVLPPLRVDRADRVTWRRRLDAEPERVRAAHLAADVDGAGSAARQEVRLLANLCMVHPAVVEDLDLRDYEALQREYSSFQAVSAEDARRAVLVLAARTGWALGELQEFSVAELTKWLESLAALNPTARAAE